MPDDALDKFGEIAVNELRDAAIQHYELLAKRHYIAKCYDSLQERLTALTEDQRQLIHECVKASIECAIDSFFQAVKDKNVSIIVDSQNIVETPNGLHNEMWGPNGWIKRFSRFPTEPSD